MSLLTTADEENKAQARFMAKIKSFASKYKVHVLVVNYGGHSKRRRLDQTVVNPEIRGVS